LGKRRRKELAASIHGITIDDRLAQCPRRGAGSAGRAGSLKRPPEPFHQIPDLILGDKDLRWIVIGEVVVCKVIVCEVVV